MPVFFYAGIGILFASEIKEKRLLYPCKNFPPGNPNRQFFLILSAIFPAVSRETFSDIF